MRDIRWPDPEAPDGAEAVSARAPATTTQDGELQAMPRKPFGVA
jgi:hypothetical protein